MALGVAVANQDLRYRHNGTMISKEVFSKFSCKMRLVFLSSGGGGTAKAVHTLIQNKVTGIFSNQAHIYILADRECGATKWAERNSIPNKIINLNQEASWSQLVNSELINKNDIIITTIHKIIPNNILQAYGKRMINIHYSLLPAFKGMIGQKTVRSSLEYGSKLLGATCHYVTKEVDGGEPICQVAYAAKSSDLDELTHQCYISGCLALINGISSLHSNNSKNLSPKNTVQCNNIEYMVNPCHADTQKALELLCQRERS